MSVKVINKLYYTGLNRVEGVGGIYYAFDEQVDFFEIDELKQNGYKISGNELSFFFYPEEKVYTPFQKEYGIYYDKLCIYYRENVIYFAKADFNVDELSLYKYRLKNEKLEKIKTFDMRKMDTYNLQIAFEPLSICSSNSERLEVYYPEELVIDMAGNEVFEFRDEDKFYFSAWFEEGEGLSYKYYEKYLVKDKSGMIQEQGVGVIERMTDSEYIVV